MPSEQHAGTPQAVAPRSIYRGIHEPDWMLDRRGNHLLWAVASDGRRLAERAYGTEAEKWREYEALMEILDREDPPDPHPHLQVVP